MDPFVQADSGISRQYGGTGLGTSIAKQLVELMGGQLQLESTPGKGSRFWFDLAFESESEGYLETDVALITNCNLLPIILDKNVAEIVMEALGDWGLNAPLATDMVQTLKHLGNASDVDALLMDIDAYERMVDHISTWKAEGLLDRDVSVIVYANASSADTDAIKLVIDKGMTYVENSAQLFNALHELMAVEQGIESGLISHQELMHSLNILVADDSSANRIIISKMLENAGHKVTSTTDGHELLEALENEEYDVVLADMHMPDMSGIEAYQLYRFAHASDELAVPFVIVTADVTKASRTACEEAGLAHVLSKPVDAKQLFDTLDYIVENKPIKADSVHVELGVSDQNTIPLINTDKAEELMLMESGNSLLSLIIDGFLSDTEAAIDAMKKAIDTQDFFEFAEQAHALTGSAANIGLTRLQAATAELEQLSEAQLLSVGKSKLEKLSSLTSDSISALSRYCGLDESSVVKLQVHH